MKINGLIKDTISFISYSQLFIIFSEIQNKRYDRKIKNFQEVKLLPFIQNEIKMLVSSTNILYNYKKCGYCIIYFNSSYTLDKNLDCTHAKHQFTITIDSYYLSAWKQHNIIHTSIMELVVVTRNLKTINELIVIL